MNQVRSATGPPARGSADDESTLTELTIQLSEQATTLAHKEVELAKAEMSLKAKHLGLGAGAYGAAGLIGVLALGALTAAAILALAEAVDTWLAALIVAVVYAAVTGGVALIGRSRVQAGTPPVPERAIESSKEDVEAAKRSAKEVRA
jgi:Putative Actinobacterial Holin-X, holin superfamily III